eukprot:TRINITY_DN5536_c0_g1_i1.p1 TRINITY_DN5536_c0_g1~~TRINITY_DN5536_c0_g1_i1.p1  ORF type:complete len:287 (-),score=88.26 TRINITY_DN5536_c0_g1_i1:96-956(-)
MATVTNEQLDAYLDFAVKKALEVGKIIEEAFYKDKEVEEKGTADLVTQTDKQVENILKESFQNQYPEHKFLGEESYDSETGYNLTNDPTWIIDPIDGTTNFVHKFPFTAVSIGLAVNRQPVVGVVYNPILKELFKARKGGGAFLNDKKIHTSGATAVSQSVISTNFGYDRGQEGITFMMGNLQSLLTHQVQSLRSGGSAACEMTNVALGRIDLYYEYGIHPWDVAASILIIEEAGGIVVDPIDGSHPVDLEVRRVAASCSKELASTVVQLLSGVKVPEKYAKLKRK